MVALNILSLYLYKKVILQATNITCYGNYQFFIVKLSNISLQVKYIIDNSIFKAKFSYISKLNNIAISIFYNHLYIGSAYCLNSISLSRYIYSIWGNWDKFDFNNVFISNIANNNNLKTEPEDFNSLENNLDNLDKLDDIYDLSLVISALYAGILASKFLSSFMFLWSDSASMKAI